MKLGDDAFDVDRAREFDTKLDATQKLVSQNSTTSGNSAARNQR